MVSDPQFEKHWMDNLQELWEVKCYMYLKIQLVAKHLPLQCEENAHSLNISGMLRQGEDKNEQRWTQRKQRRFSKHFNK